MEVDEKQPETTRSRHSFLRRTSNISRGGKLTKIGEEVEAQTARTLYDKKVLETIDKILAKVETTEIAVQGILKILEDQENEIRKFSDGHPDYSGEEEPSDAEDLADTQKQDEESSEESESIFPEPKKRKITTPFNSNNLRKPQNPFGK